MAAAIKIYQEEHVCLQVTKEESMADFRAYLEKSLNDPFTLNLKNSTLLEVINHCATAKTKLYPNYEKSIRGLTYNLRALEDEYQIMLRPIQVTDIFWGYFISFCRGRGVKPSSIGTMCCQLRSILSWAVKYNAPVSPTYTDLRLPKFTNYEIALTADDISRITYFDIDRFYTHKRKDYVKEMHKARDLFVLSCNLFQRFSDMIRISPECFERNIFRITQQKTGQVAVVNIDKYAIDSKTTYRLLEKYGHYAPYTGTIGNYNKRLHDLMRDIGFTELIRVEERIDGKLVVQNVPKYKMISSHTARRTAITVGIIRGHNMHDLKRCSGHVDLKNFDRYIRDE